MSEWIKCSERMPCIGVYVLTYYCGGNWKDSEDDPNRKVMKLRIRTDDLCPGESIFNWTEFGAFGCTDRQVSHWMPLPSPPKTSEDQP